MNSRYWFDYFKSVSLSNKVLDVTAICGQMKVQTRATKIYGMSKNTLSFKVYSNYKPAYNNVGGVN